ncbi:MAG: electron transport complex subunit RsxB [Burkholderiaceae bacterium]
MIGKAGLVERINDALPQTQCRRCGYDDCRGYAQAIANERAAINQCPPGGQEGVARLGRITGGAVLPLSALHGIEGPLRVARIDESACIGCTLCVDVCPVDCIVGAPKVMHGVIERLCTGCDLCLPVCPVDCIAMHPVSDARTGWQAWSVAQAEQARERYEFHRLRIERNRAERDQALSAKASAHSNHSA